jgi:hypothetical protein
MSSNGLISRSSIGLHMNNLTARHQRRSDGIAAVAEDTGTDIVCDLAIL